ncbi:MAG: gliding motility-associated C-terminal domain-containing protein, partial [Bacteroidetes bacterium]|nr:gliding motility-associated C-terminal domain-containing protein [Bacteroidota bacterium]
PYITLTVTDPRGCTGEDTAGITRILPLKDLLPNAFTPNGDGLNDEVAPPDLFEITDMRVYNRWGEEVYNSKGQNRGWDGTTNGKPALPGLYACAVKARLKGNANITQVGWTVVLVR